MKNKFLHGAAALALCAGFVACSEYDAGVAPETLADIKSLQYETAFVQKFGKIDPAQDWGFGSGVETRGTLPGVVDNPQNYEDIYQPEGFTSNQLEIIRLFFQNNQYLDGISYPYTEFFAQQVYKGNTKVGTQYGSAGDCTESYQSLDGNTHTSDQMNYFDVKGQDGSDFHIDSFNRGSYDRGKESGMYAVDADASEFSYINSSNSRVTGSYVIIDGETIDAWAKGAGASILQSQGISFESVATCTSKAPNGDTKTIKRYYLGFDFRLLEGEETYTGQYLEIDGKQYPCVTDNKNMYAGEKESINNFNMVLGIINNPQNYNDQQKEQYADDVEKLKRLLDEGYLPIGQNGDFVKLGTVRNGYYSDWVISITPGTVGTPNNPGDGDNDNDDDDDEDDEVVKQGRVFCEDLGSIGDFDFNDVVFDAYIYKSGKVEITLLAAGGTLPITVAGVDPHTFLGAGMVNTGVGGDGRTYTLKLSKEDAKNLGITVEGGLNSIPVVVSQVNSAGYSEDILLKTEIGKAPQKICVPVGTRWMLEYEKINNGYPKFDEWVGDSSVGEKAFTEEVKSEYLYNE